jgi:ABC-type branched-subunit amino acid transport system ATPase component
MATRERPAAPAAPSAPILAVTGLDVYYGRAHALQEVALGMERGVLGVVGRNGMGKSTLCNAIMGLVPGARGSVKVGGTELMGLSPNAIVAQGVSYVPQGRRVWPSLTVDEHLRLAARKPRADATGEPWTVQRIYATFPRLAERRGNGGAQLSGGEQQMLAIGRALLGNPRLLVMDEPTEGLAPVIVDQVVEMLVKLAQDGSISVLLIEQNLGVATAVAEQVLVMVNGRVAHQANARELMADRDLQQRLLGVRAADDAAPAVEDDAAPPIVDEPVRVFQVRRQAADAEADAPPMPAYSRRAPPPGRPPPRTRPADRRSRSLPWSDATPMSAAPSTPRAAS